MKTIQKWIKEWLQWFQSYRKKGKSSHTCIPLQTGISSKKDWQFFFQIYIVRMKEVKVWTRKTGCMDDGLLINVDFDWQCCFELIKLTQFFTPKNPRSPLMVMTLVFLNGKFLNMTVRNPIPWGCPEGCSIFFLKNDRNLKFSLFCATADTPSPGPNLRSHDQESADLRPAAWPGLRLVKLRPGPGVSAV